MIYGDGVSAAEIEKLRHDLLATRGLQEKRTNNQNVQQPTQQRIGTSQQYSVDDIEEDKKKFRQMALNLIQELQGRGFSQSQLAEKKTQQKEQEETDFAGMQTLRKANVSFNSFYDSNVFSDIIESQYESGGRVDEQMNQSLPQIVLGGVNDTQQVINTNIQGVPPAQTSSFVESVTVQFEKLFNLDQIQDAKLHDGAPKQRNKANTGK